MNVMNLDVGGAVDRIAHWARQLIGSQSRSGAEFNEHDRKRATAYLDRLIGYIDAINAPSLDLPITSPAAYPIAAFPGDEDINNIENAELKDVVRRFKAAYVELAGPQSKDQTSGFLPADVIRMKKLVENTRKVIELGSVAEDLPEQANDTPPTM